MPLPDLPWKMEGKYIWNVFNQWLLESRGYTLLILECVCPGKGSITHGKYLYLCQIICTTVLSLSRAAKSDENTNEIRKSKVTENTEMIMTY